MFLYHFFHIFSWFLWPGCYRGRVVPTVKDLYASFAVLYIAPSGKNNKFTRISTYWTGLFIVRPTCNFFPVCPIELDTKRTLCIDAPENALTVWIPHLSFFQMRDVTFLPFPTICEQCKGNFLWGLSTDNANSQFYLTVFAYWNFVYFCTSNAVLHLRIILSLLTLFRNVWDSLVISCLFFRRWIPINNRKI